MQNIDLIIPMLNFKTFIFIISISYVIYYKCFYRKIKNITIYI